MGEPSNEEIVRSYWLARGKHDHATVSSLRHADWTVEWPQSGELVRGDANDQRIMDEYPGGEPHFDTTRIVGSEDRWVATPSFTLARVVGSGDFWWGDGIGTYPDGSRWYIVSLVEIRDGKIWREVAYFAPPLDPPEWRSAYVEPLRSR